jgi:sec-independent protein translocase protein TatA
MKVGRKFDPPEDETMGDFSIWHWIIVLMVVLLLFGRGKVSELMADVAKGVKSFRKGLSDDDEPPQTPTKPVETTD